MEEYNMKMPKKSNVGVLSSATLQHAPRAASSAEKHSPTQLIRGNHL